MPGIHVQVALKDAAGNLGDVAVNTFSFASADVATVNMAEQMVADVAGFYSQVQASGFSLSTYMSEALDATTDAHVVKAYDLSGVKLSGGPGNPLGAPIAEDRFTLAPSQATLPLPNELAVCVTLEGSGRALAAVEIGSPPNVTRPKQRHTGRFYLGPLNTGSIYPGAPGALAHVHPSLITTANQAVQWLHDQAQANGFLGLGVWSRANASIYPLESVSVDLDFDVVRSRGIRSGTGRVRASIS